MNIQEVISEFNTTPFIFAGSGITRRYYGLPDWKGLLTFFAQKVGKDEFSYQAYENRAKYESDSTDIMPVIASLIEKDFNEAWFDNRSGIRTDSEIISKSVSQGASPFKAELCEYIRGINNILPEYKEEIVKLEKISKNNIAGIITTNYDEFFESIFNGYKTFVGQDELVFSQLQGIAEIYKIHGSVSKEDSIVINQEDYIRFKEKSKYLAAKLMTIFMEYPIIFMGYSLTDSDIRSIIADIVQCLPGNKLSLLQQRFVFVEYKTGTEGSIVSSHSMVFDNKTIEMTKIILSDFGILYDALTKKKAAFPVKILRRFKDDLYSFILTNEPNEMMRVAPLEDDRVDEETLALTIGLAPTGTYGLGRAVDSEKWYRNVICHDLQFSSDELLGLVYLELAKQNSWKIPVWYYLDKAKNDYPEIREKAPQNYSDIVSNDQIVKNRVAIRSRSMKEIWDQEKNNISRAIRLLGNIPYEKVDADVLEQILKTLFEKYPNILSSDRPNDKTNLRRLIRIYDFLKYKRPHD